MTFILHKRFPPADDAQLIRLYKESGELNHLGRLFEKYMPLVYGVCLRYLDEEAAKDAVMQIFEELITALKQHEVRHFKSWLHVLSRNHCLMKLRKMKSTEGGLVSMDEEIMENSAFAHPDNGLFTEERLQAMEKCMETLPEEQRRSVDLFYLQEKSYKEISAITGYDGKKVKSYIQNGKRNLKICMEKDHE